MSVTKTFEESDSVLARCVKTVTDIILTPFLMNVDFADVKNVLKDSGIALIGYGIGTGANKCKEAVENAVNSPLLETGISGARRALCTISFGPQVIFNDVTETIALIKKCANQNVNLKFAINKNPALSDDIIVSIIASDYENAQEILNQNSKPMDIFNTIAKDEKPKDEQEIAEEEETVVTSDDVIPSFLDNDEDDILY